MKTIGQALNLVYSDYRYLILGIAVGLVIAVSYLTFRGLVVVVQDHLFFDLNLVRAVTFISLSALVGLVVPLQIFAIKKAAFSLKAASATGTSIFAGLATLSCCAPLVLPAFLAFLGFSGLFIVQFNTLVYQYLLEFSLFSITLLLVSLFLVSKTVVAACRLRH